MESKHQGGVTIVDAQHISSEIAPTWISLLIEVKQLCREMGAGRGINRSNPAQSTSRCVCKLFCK